MATATGTAVAQHLDWQGGNPHGSVTDQVALDASASSGSQAMRNARDFDVAKNLEHGVSGHVTEQAKLDTEPLSQHIGTANAREYSVLSTEVDWQGATPHGSVTQQARIDTSASSGSQAMQNARDFDASKKLEHGVSGNVTEQVKFDTQPLSQHA